MLLSLKQTLNQDSPADPNDVLQVKKALIKTGHYDLPDYGLTPYPDTILFTAIKNFQKDSGLKVNGIICPHGKTIAKLNEELNKENPGVKSPIIRCPQCGGPHGGSKGDLCPDCDAKS